MIENTSPSFIENNHILSGGMENEYFGDHRIVSGNYFLTAKVKEKPFVIENLIPEGALTALTSESGKGKSLFMLILALHISLGKKLFEVFEVKQKNVLILDLEMDEDILISRYQSFISEEAPIYYMHNQHFDIEEEEDFEWLIDQIKEKNIGFLVIDTISNIYTVDENSATEMKSINRKLLTIIQRTNTTIMYLHHHRKKRADEKNSQGSARGSTEIIAKVASHLILDSKKSIEESGNQVLTVTIEQHKSRRPESIGKVGLIIIHDPIVKKSKYDYIGEIDQAKQSLKEAKDFIKSFTEIGKEYSVQDLDQERKKQMFSFGVGSIRDACKELLIEGFLDSHKGEGKAWNKQFYFKA